MHSLKLVIKEVDLIKEISLTQGKSTIVDDMDYDFLNQWKWCAHCNRNIKYKELCYAERSVHLDRINGKKLSKHIRMHRLIMERILKENGEFDFLKKFKENPRKYPIDHIDGDGLKNTRDNLRIVNNRENCQNRHDSRTSNYPGVFQHESRGWISSILSNGKNVYLGQFNEEIEAAKAYEWAYNEIKKGNLIPRLSPAQTSKYKGVSWDKKSDKWVATIGFKGKCKKLGSFLDEKEAYYSYLQAVKIIKGNNIDEINELIKTRKPSSRYKGVSWHKGHEKWQARITVNGKRLSLGFFKDEHQGYLAVKKAKEELIRISF